MRKSLNRIFATAATVSLVASMFVTSSVSAASATGMKDTLDREKVSVAGVVHTLVATFPTGTWDNTETVIVDYGTTSFNLVNSSPSCVLGTGTCTAAVTTASDLVTITCTDTACGGLLTLGTFTGTNPSGAGSKTITMAGTGGIDGSFAIPIVDEDQITVTASVDPSITFVASARVGGIEAYDCSDVSAEVAGGTVALGTLTTGSITSSDVNAVRHICTRMSTNATSGAIVTVKSASNNGLVSTSVGGDNIPSASAAMSAGVANYGLCVSLTGSTTSTPSSANPVKDFSSCSNDTAAGTVTAVTTSAQTVWHVTAPTSNAFADVVVKAAISGTTRAHSDYTDTLTFVATGTF